MSSMSDFMVRSGWRFFGGLHRRGFFAVARRGRECHECVSPVSLVDAYDRLLLALETF